MNLTDINYIKVLLKQHGLKLSKTLGQNFIINSEICPKISEYGNARPGFGIIEIGTGIGVLTAELAKRADKVVAIELDSRLIPILNETLSCFDNIKIVNQDIMTCDINKIISEEFKEIDIAVCANLPYYITSPIIMMLLEKRLPIKSITVMVQKEAAERLCAAVGTREAGAITVAVNYYGKAKKLFDVTRDNFYPSPNVDSSVIRIDINDVLPLSLEDEKFFFNVVRSGFSQRRKTLANSLSSFLKIDKKIIYYVLEKMNIPVNSRIEQLKMEQLINLSINLKSAI